MERIRAVIVDDEPFTHVQLKGRLQAIAAAVDVVAEASDAATGAEVIRAHRPDLVFLDVQLPDRDGFDLLDGLSERGFGVIFITAFDRYAIRAIRYSALDYLLKPVEADELRQAIARFTAQRQAQPERIRHLLRQGRGSRSRHESIVIVTRLGDRQLRTTDIVRCEADSNYTAFHLRNGERLVASYTLASYEDLLSANGFLRIHRSHMVNGRAVERIDREGRVVLRDGTTLEVSRRRRDEVMAQWQAWRDAP